MVSNRDSFFSAAFLTTACEEEHVNVGYKFFQLTDQSRDELLTDDPLDKRTITAQVFYPTESPEAILPDNRKDIPYRICDKVNVFTLWEGFTEKRGDKMSLFVTCKDTVRVMANEGGPVASYLDNYPVLLFSGGFGGYSNQNTTQIRGLVKSGFVVVAIGHTYLDIVVSIDGNDILICDQARDLLNGTSNPENPETLTYATTVELYAQDASFVLTELKKLNDSEFDRKLDLERVGYFGHSIGGAAAALSLQNDQRIDAAISMDGMNHPDVIENGLSKPWFFMISQQGWNADLGPHIFNMPLQLEKIWPTLPAGNMFVIDKSAHNNYSDVCHFNDPILYTASKAAGLCGMVNNKKMDKIMVHYSVAFFRKYLNGTDEPILDNPEYPELTEFWSK